MLISSSKQNGVETLLFISASENSVHHVQNKSEKTVKEGEKKACCLRSSEPEERHVNEFPGSRVVLFFPSINLQSIGEVGKLEIAINVDQKKS